MPTNIVVFLFVLLIMTDVKFSFRKFQVITFGKLVDMKISFDFDFTLSENEIQFLCKTLKRDPNKILF